ncbi:MAG: homocysteine S-methyltransferase family protein [Eubacterium sp.]|nr:homocysteine S-methyltransferase family protein [Eubacterium sp.]
MDKLKKLFDQKEFVIFDGAVGTEIQKQISNFSIPESLNFSHPEIIKKIIQSYAESGSDMISANTFGANRFKLSDHGLDIYETIDQAVKIAREALLEFPDVLIGLDCSTLGKLLEPGGELSFEEAYGEYREIMLAAGKSGVDFILIETMTDLYEIKAALLAAKENTSIPVICSMSFESNGRTFTGCAADVMAMTLTGLGADAIGVNCSLGPNELIPVAEKLLRNTDLPVMVKPNAGLPDPETGKFTLSAADFSEQMKEFAKMGVKILGGCCGTTPDHILNLKKAIKNITFKKKIVKHNNISVSSATRAVNIDRPRIIGERINPTGKKLFKEALLNNNIEYILSQAIEQVNDGAEILDVNVGLPGIDEKLTMVNAIKAIQGVVDVPLQIDSGDPNVIEAALRVYNGKPIVNSVNGEEKTMREVFPLVKKYGACVLGLTLDENGIPKMAEERFKIAEKILNMALSYGIPRGDVFIDCLTLTASAQQDSVMETLKALKMVKKKLGLKTVLGVSNISFGLPNRELINHTFLAMALESGLDLPIINPNILSMSGTVRAFRVLAGHDKNSEEYIDIFSGIETSVNTVQKAAPKSRLSKEIIPNETIEYAILKGLKSKAKEFVERLLDKVPSMEIIENHLIPALDKVGVLFEQNKLFLPQLILSAEAAGACFELIKKRLSETGETSMEKGKIIIATVRGDIHDIGKNIVKRLLENYGYQVIDLGKDVPEEEVLSAAIKHDVNLVGLSALMTTTLGAMESTIKLLRKERPKCKIMVGGAVLTKDYAQKIDADYYAKDAQEAVAIAKKELG